MGWYGLFLIAALIIVSGLIAYVGDVIGRRMGRRRLTLFGLRPRYTAVAISVFAGMLIAGFTLVSAMLASQNVRDALLHMNEIRMENARLERAAEALQVSRENAQRGLDEARQRLAVVTKALESQSALLERQRRELVAARSRLRAASKELAAKIAELTQQKQNLEAVTARLKQASADLDAQRAELAARQRELDAARADLAATQAKLNDESKQLSDVEAKLADANTQLDNANRVMRETARALFSLERQRDQLQAEIQDLTQWRSQARQAFQVMTTQPVIFGANEEIMAAVIPARRPTEQIRADLDDFVGLLNRVAIAAGAGAGDNGQAIDISRPDYTADQVLSALAEAISGATGSVIVRAASARNVVKGAAVPVDFQLFHNELVFHEGDELARTSVDSGQDEARLLLQLVEFLRTRVSARARAAGVMPRPATHPGQVTEGLFPAPGAVVGEMTYPELLAAIREIKSHKGTVQLVARAAADTWTAGPLDVKLSVAGRP
jgi:uncharacterized protein (DUF3084 family)